MFRLFREIQPELMGIFTHSFLWATSAGKDIIYPNPKFKPSLSETKSKKVVIYCIHGTADRVSAFTLIASRLIKDLPETISSIKLVAFNHRGEGRKIQDFAEQLRDKILENQDEEVILLDHSRGGLVGAYFSEYLAAEANIRVHALFNICTPFLGSDLAIPPLSWISASVKQMERNSDFLKELSDRIKHSDKQYYYISAKNDAIVYPSSACIPEHQHKLVTLDGYGHLSIMSAPEVVDYIRNRLNALTKILDPASQNKEDNFMPELSEYIFVPEAHELTPLDRICLDIDLAIQQLMLRFHLFPATEKINVLMKLLTAFRDMLDGDRGGLYPDALTIDGFINAFLQDPLMGEGRKPMEILTDPLNFPFSLVSSLFTESKTNPHSHNFIGKILEEYKNISLPLKNNCNQKNEVVF